MQNDVIDQPIKSFEPGEFWPRVGATLLDGLVVAVVTGFPMMYSILYWESYPILTLSILAGQAYKPLMEWQYGATLGKMVLGLKVVDADTLESPSLDQAIMRYWPWIISMCISLTQYSYLFSYEEYQNSEGFFERLSMISQSTPSWLSTMSSVYSIVFVLIMVMIATDKLRQGLHDKTAGTYCVVADSLQD